MKIKNIELGLIVERPEKGELPHWHGWIYENKVPICEVYGNQINKDNGEKLLPLNFAVSDEGSNEDEKKEPDIGYFKILETKTGNEFIKGEAKMWGFVSPMIGWIGRDKIGETDIKRVRIEFDQKTDDYYNNIVPDSKGILYCDRMATYNQGRLAENKEQIDMIETINETKLAFTPEQIEQCKANNMAGASFYDDYVRSKTGKVRKATTKLIMPS